MKSPKEVDNAQGRSRVVSNLRSQITALTKERDSLSEVVGRPKKKCKKCQNHLDTVAIMLDILTLYCM